MSDPVTIGLVGAPGSGKSRLAKALADYFGKDDTAVVDRYVAKVKRDYNIELGKHATYFGDIAVALGRVGAERLAYKKEPKAVITCGTHIDTITYASITAYLESPQKDQDAMTLHMNRVSAIMRFLGLLTTDTYGYDCVFYLPAEYDPESYEKRVNDEMKIALEAFAIDASGQGWATLTPGKHLEQAIAHLETYTLEKDDDDGEAPTAEAAQE